MMSGLRAVCSATIFSVMLITTGDVRAMEPVPVNLASKSGFIQGDFDRVMANGRDLFKAKKYDQLITEMNKHRFAGRQEAERAFMIGLAHLRLKQFPKAIEWNQKAFELDGKFASAAYNEACAYALWGKPDEANAALEKMARGIATDRGKRKRMFDLMKKDPDVASLRKTKGYKLAVEVLIYGMTKQEHKVAKTYVGTITKTADMVNNSKAARLVNATGLGLMNITWEDTGRYKDSAVGPNISDMTIQVGFLNPISHAFESRLMPVIRYDNFNDKTGDIDPRNFTLLVGNEKGEDLRRISLFDFLEDPTAYLNKPDSWKAKKKTLLAPRDEKVLVSAQAAFLPVPLQGKATFNPVLFNYQSVEGDPAVLTLLVTPEGTSATVIDNQRDAFDNGSVWGQRLFFNENGQRASLTGERKKEVLKKRAAGKQVRKQKGAQVADEALNMVLVVQIPLKQKSPPQMAYGSGGIYEDEDGDYGAEEMEFDDAEAPMEAAASSDVDEAVISYGEVEGPFTEIDDLEIERDDRYPVRVTVQFYKATSNGVINQKNVADIKKQIDSVYAEADYVGSLVTGGATGRITEYDGAKVQPAGWWEDFWQRYEKSHKIDRLTAIKRLRRMMGQDYDKQPVTDLYLRTVLHD